MTITTQSRESELVFKAAQGCRTSFDEVVEANYRGVYVYAMRLLANGDDAADAAQVTFVKAYRSLKEFDTTRPLKPWLYRICANVCTDIARGRNRTAEPLENHAYMLESGQNVEEEAEKAELGDAIRLAVQRLPERYRRIIVMRHFEQLDVEEIALRLRAPEGTIKSWLFRARALLRRDLTENLKKPAAQQAKLARSRPVFRRGMSICEVAAAL